MIENPAVKDQERDDARRERHAERCERAQAMLAEEFHTALSGGHDVPLSVHAADALGLPLFTQAPLLDVVGELIGRGDDVMLAGLLDVTRRFYLRDDALAVSVVEEMAQAYAAREVDTLHACGAFNDGAEYDDGH